MDIIKHTELDFWLDNILTSIRWLTSEKLHGFFRAKRLHIRDLGSLLSTSGRRLYTHGEIYQNTLTSISTFFQCPAFVRLGKQEDKTILWCWRCEKIIGEYKPGEEKRPNLGGAEPLISPDIDEFEIYLN